MTTNGHGHPCEEDILGIDSKHTSRPLDAKGRKFWDSVKTKVFPDGWEDAAIKVDPPLAYERLPAPPPPPKASSRLRRLRRRMMLLRRRMRDLRRHNIPPEFHRNVPPELPAETVDGKTLKALLDNGQSLDHAAKAMKALGENSTGIPPEFHRTIVKDPVAEKRRAYDRMRKAKKKLAAKTAAEIPPEKEKCAPISISSTLPFLEENTRKESKNTGITRARVKRTAHRIPDDWQPSEADLATARKYLPDDRIPIEATKFRNYWLGRGDRKAVSTNWSLNWENWCVNALEYSGGRNAVRSGTGLPNSQGGHQAGGFGNGAGASGGQNRSRGGFSAFAMQSARRAAERMDRRGQRDPGEGVVELDSINGPPRVKTRTD